MPVKLRGSTFSVSLPLSSESAPARRCSSPGALPLPGESAGPAASPWGGLPPPGAGCLLSGPGGPFLSLPALSPLWQGKPQGGNERTGREDPAPAARGKALAVCDLSQPLCPFSSYPSPSPARPPLSPPRPTDPRRLTLPGAPGGRRWLPPQGLSPPPPHAERTIPAALGRRGSWSRPPPRGAPTSSCRAPIGAGAGPAASEFVGWDQSQVAALCGAAGRSSTAGSGHC